MRTRYVFTFITFLFFSGLSAQWIPEPELPYSPSNQPRMVAEWEPAVGVLIVWPLSIPKELVVDLGTDTKLYVLVEGPKPKLEAIQWFTKWGITPDHVRFITAPQGIDASWTRDWGPHAIFSTDGEFSLGDPKYAYATPVTGLACDDSLHFLYYNELHQIELTKTEDEATEYIATALDVHLTALPFSFTGGNVISDGQQSGFSTCIITNENRYTGVSDETFFNDLDQYLGLTSYHIISNFETDGIQHIDCFMKMLDEERLLVIRPPHDHPAYDIYEGIVTQELSRIKNAYGRPYQILRLDTERYTGDQLAAYSNALILNQHVYVPLFGIPQDTAALRQWREAMPGYTVKGYTFPLNTHKKWAYYDPKVYSHYDSIGWTGGDALHCRTRAIWDPNMIYISVDRLPATMIKAKSYAVDVIIKDYSKGSLVPEGLILNWRVQGDKNWKDVRLTPTGIKDHFAGYISGNMADVTIEYYVEAKSNWGTKAVMPRTAPKGVYSFSIN